MLSIWVVPQVIILSHIAFDMGQFLFYLKGGWCFVYMKAPGKRWQITVKLSEHTPNQQKQSAERTLRIERMRFK